MTFQMRNFTKEDFKTVRDWRVKLGWNPGIFDHLAFETIDKEGFWIGLLDRQPIGAIGAVQYDDNFAAVGMYMVKKQHQGKGYGIQLWNKALSRITAKTVGLYGATQHETKFQKCKFQTCFKSIRYSLNGKDEKYTSSNLKDCKKIEIQSLIKYDKGIFPIERKRFLQKWIQLPQSKALVFMKQNKIQGYGVIRLSGEGYKLGPLFADNYEVAEQILKGLISHVPSNKQFCIDVPETNKNGLRLARQWNMKEVFDCVRMFTNESIDIHIEQKVFGITCLQFG